MIFIKTKEEIEIIRDNNILVSRTLAEVAKCIAPGVTTKKLDAVAEEFIRDNGAIPGFLGYHGFPSTLCTSINDVVVHGIPSDNPLKDGDIISVDVGTKMNGFYGDSAYTFMVGEVSNDVKMLVQRTKKSLKKGVDQMIAGNRIGDIGHAIQKHVEGFGYSVVREMVGHGLGANMHEDPEVPNYGKAGKGPLLKEGMVLCVEPMINLGKKEIYQEDDGWTIRTRDSKQSAHFEYCVAVTKDGPDILTTYDFIEEVLSKK